MTQEAVSIGAPDSVWQVLGPSDKTQVFPMLDVILPFAAGNCVIPKMVTLKTLGITPQANYVDVNAGGPYIIIGAANGSVGYILPEAKLVNIDSILTTAGITGNWAPVYRVMRTHHTHQQQF